MSVSPAGPRDKPVVAVFRSPLFNPSEGFVQAQAAGLTRYEPLVVGLEDHGNALPALRSRLLVTSSRWQGLHFKLFGPSAALISRVRAHRPLLVHAHFATDGLLALPLAKRLGLPLITTLRGYDVNRSRASMLLSGRLSWTKYALFRRRLMQEGNLFLAVSDALRTKALAQGYPSERTITHYNGVDLTRFRFNAKSAQRELILHVGRLTEKKGTALLINAFEKVKRRFPDATLAIVGEGPLEARLRAQSATLGLESSVRFLGALGLDEIAAWMRDAWVLAAPSVTARDGDAEGLPNVIVEAAASGLPVIGSRHAGIPEAIEDGVTGFIVPEGEVTPLAARLLDLLQSHELRSAMGQAARRLAETRFDFTRQMERLEAYYDRLTGRVPKGAEALCA